MRKEMMTSAEKIKNSLDMGKRKT